MFSKVSESFFLYLIVIVNLAIIAGIGAAIYNFVTLNMYIEIMLRLAPLVGWVILMLIQFGVLLISFKRLTKFGYVIKPQADINNKIMPDGTNVFSGFPFYMIFLTIYPILFLFSNNIREISATLFIRPALVSLALMVLVYFVHWVILRRYAQKAFIVSSVLITLFLMYGYIYSILIEQFEYSQGSFLHQVLTGIFVVIYLLSYRFSKFLINKTDVLNLVSLTLIVFPLIQIGSHVVGTWKSNISQESGGVVEQEVGEGYPDIYYIILDQYSRSDIMKLYDYDNSYFIEFLEDRGFYVADCSLSNYRKTNLSLTSSLNMDFVYNAVPNSGIRDESVQPIHDYLVHNRVRRELEDRGYEIFAFESGYNWNEWFDADVYLSPISDVSLLKSNINHFEIIFLQTTFLKMFYDQGLFWDLVKTAGSHSFELTHYVLDTLPLLADLDGPKFVESHLMVPHAPHYYMPDGSFNENISELGDGFNLEGYYYGVEFISNAIQPVIDSILENSARPPVIIIQGDHGYGRGPEEGFEYAILNAYHLPDGGNEYLYPDITPVNSFRLVFNLYFGTEYPMLDDLSIDTDIGGPYRTEIKEFPDHFEECVPNR